MLAVSLLSAVSRASGYCQCKLNTVSYPRALSGYLRNGFSKRAMLTGNSLPIALCVNLQRPRKAPGRSAVHQTVAAVWRHFYESISPTVRHFHLSVKKGDYSSDTEHKAPLRPKTKNCILFDKQTFNLS